MKITMERIYVKKTSCINQRKRIKKLFVFLAIVLLTVNIPIVPLSAEEKDNDNSVPSSKIIVSLGDSYSSGEGIEEFYGQDLQVEQKVKNQDWLAHRSKNSWSGMLTLPDVDGTMAENRNTNWFFVAASGAKTEHLTKSFSKSYDKDGNKGTVSLEPQLNVFNQMKGQKADYVTMTMGGNDVGFSDIVTEVMLGSTYLNYSKLSDKISDTWDKFYEKGGIRDDLENAYKKIAEKAGEDTNIIIAGYPKLLDAGGKGALVSVQEATEVNAAVSSFNDAIKQIVSQCSLDGMNIHFVSVEEAFDGHEAYSDDPYINEVYLYPKSEDLEDGFFVIPKPSAYSIHPNLEGARAYAMCVQEKIDELEELKKQEADKLNNVDHQVVLVLDNSGSMRGNALSSTIDATKGFVDNILKNDVSIGLVTYASSAKMVSNFSVNASKLKGLAAGMSANGGTDIEAGLSQAYTMLKNSNASRRIIVLMSDGQPNKGVQGEALIAYANQLKEQGITLYTLGFFESVSNNKDKAAAQQLMGAMANAGCHYEVSSADDLALFFGDIAEQLGGQKYIYVRIACPVNVKVNYDGQELNSDEQNQNLRTDFGTLTFEESEDGNADDKVKVLRLKEGADYNIRIDGYGTGDMDYTIGFMDDSGKYSDMRKFESVSITENTVIDTVAANLSKTVLNVDRDGDGTYDVKYEADANGKGKMVVDVVISEPDYRYIYGVIAGTVVFIILLIIGIVFAAKAKRRINQELGQA